jgi:hypothetical protein
MQSSSNNGTTAYDEEIVISSKTETHVIILSAFRALSPCPRKGGCIIYSTRLVHLAGTRTRNAYDWKWKGRAHLGKRVYRVEDTTTSVVNNCQ